MVKVNDYRCLNVQETTLISYFSYASSQCRRPIAVIFNYQTKKEIESTEVHPLKNISHGTQVNNQKTPSGVEQEKSLKVFLKSKNKNALKNQQRGDSRGEGLGQHSSNK